MKRILSALRYIRHRIKIWLAFPFYTKTSKIVITATPTHGNLGDQAIVYAEKHILSKSPIKKCVLEVENGGYLTCVNAVKKHIKSEDIIAIDGGGNLGTLWPWEDDKISDIISTFKENKIVVFPQTMYYDDTPSAAERIKKNRVIYSKARDLTFLFRDSSSYDFFTKTFNGVNAKLCPDIVLSLDEQKTLPRKNVLLCFREDRERVINDDELSSIKQWMSKNNLTFFATDTVIDKTVRAWNRKKELNRKWKEFSSARLVITDRLHAMIFSYITGTPCIALNNKSKKVEGTYDFIKNCNFIKLADDSKDVIELIPELLGIKKIEKGAFDYPMEIIEECFSNGKSD